MQTPELGRRSLLAGGVAAVAGTAMATPALGAEKAATAVPERLKGYTYPLSAKGIANLAGPPPWNYVGDLLGVEFWTSPGAANASLPTGLSPDPAAPGHGYALFIDWQFAGSNEEYLDPARSRYSEFLILLDATYQGAPVAWCPFIYVDNDTSLARGWAQGFPKKMGQVHTTRTFAIDSKAGPVLGAGGKFAASASYGGQLLANARVTLQTPATTIPALGRPIVNLRHYPRLTLGHYNDPAVHELTQSILDGAKTANNWTGTGQLSFPPAVGEEVSDLAPQRVGAGFRGTLSYSVTDLKILA
jgi:acetoacetate decarboxylase